MTVQSWLTTATLKLTEAGIGTARLDCLVLLEDATRKDRGWLLAHPEYELTVTQVEKLDNQINRRAKHEPLAYIRGKTEFYGREFIVNKDVLEPRPETETMIGLLESLPLPNRPKIIDVGTGSGAIGVTAKLERPEAQVIATDIDPSCLKITRQNARKHAAKITTIEADLLAHPMIQNPRSKIFAVLANLPYVPDNWNINNAASHEPRLAIFGGGDGLDLYRRLFDQLKKQEQKPAFILTESLPPQHDSLQAIAQSVGFSLLETDDFIQLYTGEITPEIERPM